MNNGQAFIHINGVEYLMAGRYTSADSPGFQNLVIRVDEMITGGEKRSHQRFDVIIQGCEGHVVVDPRLLVSAALVFVPDPTVEVIE